MTCRRALTLSSLLFACTPQQGTTNATSNAITDATTDVANTTAASASETSATSPTSPTTTAPTTDDPGTTADPAGLQRCAATCSEPAGEPCRIDGGITVFLCTDGVCQLPGCTTDDTCHQAAAGWIEHCADDTQCASPDHACVDPGDGDGRCAPLQTPRIQCTDLGLVPVARPPIAGGRDVIVCIDDAASCVDGRCFNPCKSDEQCPPQLGQPHCELATGLCRCSGDAECLASGQPGLVVCLAGTCGCTVDADCVGGKNVDTCVDGACGCSSTAACTNPVFNGAIQICQPT